VRKDVIIAAQEIRYYCLLRHAEQAQQGGRRPASAVLAGCTMEDPGRLLRIRQRKKQLNYRYRIIVI
jgi:hypothetical protein